MSTAFYKLLISCDDLPGLWAARYPTFTAARAAVDAVVPTGLKVEVRCASIHGGKIVSESGAYVDKAGIEEWEWTVLPGFRKGGLLGFIRRRLTTKP